MCDLKPTQPIQTQQAQHEAQHEAQQAAQPALQPPVLALLISGIPPIVLGTFQGDMQRARIILEAAGFLLPVDLSSSLLPPNLNSSPPLQHAAAPAVHALPAGLQTAQAAAQGGVYTSGEEEEEGLPVQRAAVSGVEQAVTEGKPCFSSQMPLSRSNSHSRRVINPCCHGSVLVSYCTFAFRLHPDMQCQNPMYSQAC